MSDKLIKMHGAVSEVVANAIKDLHGHYPVVSTTQVTINLKKVLNVARVTPTNRLAFHEILKERNLECKVSSMIKDNYHLTIDVDEIILTKPEAMLFEAYFDVDVNPTRITKYIS